MAAANEPSSSFKTWRINHTTFAVLEHDAYSDMPIIYAKLHPIVPMIILTDTGSDKPSKEFEDAQYTCLRRYLEEYPIAANDHQPLNPGGSLPYVIICTHCHYDHTLGIPQFLSGGTATAQTDVIASAAGRDFIETDFAEHGEFPSDRPLPEYTVTHWAQALERLTYPLKSSDTARQGIDLGIATIQTPGHTPDSLAWYDHGENHLYVGDSFYQAGKEDLPIIWTKEGNLVEWVFSMRKLLEFVKAENARLEERACHETAAADDDDWLRVASRVKVGAGHQTSQGDAEELLRKVLKLWEAVLNHEISPETTYHSEAFDDGRQTWRPKGDEYGMYFSAPAQLMEDARQFFGIKSPGATG